MPSAERATSVNRLLEVLPERSRRQLMARFETVELPLGSVLYSPLERLRYVYFPTSSVLSLIMPIDGSPSLEVGLVGNEGMFGVPLVLGVEASPMRAVVLGAGSALRMDGALFCRELRRIPLLQRQIDRHVFVHLSQLAQAVACMRFHVVEARLARRLLMAQDRAQTNTFHITHQFMASMLGVRRVGVTTAASSLQKRSLIRYNRGDITVLDRRGLKAASCGCYEADRECYDRILGRRSQVKVPSAGAAASGEQEARERPSRSGNMVLPANA